MSKNPSARDETVEQKNGESSRLEDVFKKASPKKAEGTQLEKVEEVQVSPPNIKIVSFRLIGTHPLVQHKFSAKARNIILATQEAGSQAKKGKKRDPKDFDEGYQNARHIAAYDLVYKSYWPLDFAVVELSEQEQWDGIHAGGFRAALVDACKLVGFHMTKAKLGVFIVADGMASDNTPLVKITEGTPRKVIHEARNANGSVDLRSRPMWDPGWQCILKIRYDSDMFSTTDILNLLSRVGAQCGIGEGRPNSTKSTGCDWGMFRVETA